MILLAIINPQGEKTTLSFSNISDCESLMEDILEKGSCCKFEIYTDEWVVITNRNKKN